jgi:hypothetical protein
MILPRITWSSEQTQFISLQYRRRKEMNTSFEPYVPIKHQLSVLFISVFYHINMECYKFSLHTLHVRVFTSYAWTTLYLV